MQRRNHEHYFYGYTGAGERESGRGLWANPADDGAGAEGVSTVQFKPCIAGARDAANCLLYAASHLELSLACHGAHAGVAAQRLPVLRRFQRKHVDADGGAGPGTSGCNPADAPLPDKDKAMLLFVLKATQTPKTVEKSDLDQLRALGWSDGDIMDAVYHGARNVAVDIVFNAFKIDNDF
jgi:hypothetical protein